MFNTKVLLNSNHLRYHWLIDSSLGLDIPSRHQISGSRETTLLATEFVPSFSICLIDKFTIWASSACVFWVNIYNNYTQKFSLIPNKAFQLIESSITHSSSLRLTSLNSISNAIQIFKSRGIRAGEIR